MTKEQDIERVEVFSERQRAREKINLFHGSSNNWMNMVKELIGNSLDIFKKRQSINNEIIIKIHNSNKIEYMDNATGIPVEGTASNGMPNYEALFETSFAGTNYKSEFETVGQNGIFLWSLTMTSENIEYNIARPNKNIYNIAYHKGHVSKEFNISGKSDKTYTHMIFELDRDVWTKPNFTYSKIVQIADVQASVGNVTIKVFDLEHNQEAEFCYEGRKSYFDNLISNKKIVSDMVYINSNKEYEVEIKGKNVMDRFSTDIYFCYSSDSDDDVKKELLNTADLVEYGTIQEGMILGMKNSIHKYLKDSGKYQKNEKNITIDDVALGLNYISDSYSLYCEYENQTKVKTSTERYRDIMKSIIEDYLDIFAIENKKQMEKICETVLDNKRIRESSEVKRTKLKKEFEDKVKNATNRPDKFTDCRSKDPSIRELYLIEGESAKNTIETSRDSIFMCLYSLKGKPLNVLKCKSIDEALNNQEIKDIFKILGCGVSYKGKSIKGMPKFDINNLTVDKIIITTDMDVDGYHIQSLLLGLFYTLAPELIKQGKVYLLHTPLYVINIKGKEIYAYTEEERNDIVKQLNEQNIKFKETRFKGLGGLSPQIMSKTAMDMDNRRLEVITWNDIQQGEEVMEMFLSDDKKRSAERADYIDIHGHKFFDFSLLEEGV